MNEAELWRARCDALLRVFMAAQRITGAGAVVIDSRGRVYVNRQDYDRLQGEVEDYLKMAMADEKETL